MTHCVFYLFKNIMEKIAKSFQYRMLAELPEVPGSAQTIPQALIFIWLSWGRWFLLLG